MLNISPLLSIHIIAGATALLAGAAALIYKKGGLRHRQVGRWFVISMLVMCAFGAYIAYLTPNTITVLAGSLTAYMVVSSWLTVKRKSGVLGQAERVLALVPLAVAVSAYLHGAEAAASPTGYIEGIEISAQYYYFFAIIAMLAATGDCHMLWRGGRNGEFRIARHLWRMCFAMNIATTSLFEGQAHLFPQGVQDSGALSIPGNLVLLAMLYWLIKPWAARLWRAIFNPSKANTT